MEKRETGKATLVKKKEENSNVGVQRTGWRKRTEEGERKKKADKGNFEKGY